MTSLNAIRLWSDEPSRNAEYRALALMYVTQGLPSGLAFYALGTLIRQSGHGVGDVGLVGIAFLPWALKFLWAAPVDNACARWGHARVIGVSQALLILLCLVLTGFDPGSNLSGALVGVLLLNTVAATQDIATNAYAVGRLQGRSAGPANAIQVAAFVAGMLLGGGGLLVVVDHAGWQGAMLALAALLLALYVPLMLDRRWQASHALDVAGAVAMQPLARVRLRDLRRHRDLGWALLLALSFKFAGTAVETLAQPWLVDRGLGLSEIGGLQTLRLIATAVGGVLLGIPLVRRLGNRQAVLVSATLVTLLLGTTWTLHLLDIRALWLLSLTLGIEALFAGAMYVSVWALFMNWASPERPGTDYTAMQCCESLANAVAASVIGGLGAHWGYGMAFGGAWLAGFVVLVVMAWALRRMHIQGPREV